MEAEMEAGAGSPEKRGKSRKIKRIIIVSVAVAVTVALLPFALSGIVYSSVFGRRFETEAVRKYTPADFEGLVHSARVPGLDITEFDLMGLGDRPEGIAGFHDVGAVLGGGGGFGRLSGGLCGLAGLGGFGLRRAGLGQGVGRQNQFLTNADFGGIGDAVGAGEGLPCDAVLIGDSGERVTGFDNNGALSGGTRGGGGAGLGADGRGFG